MNTDLTKILESEEHGLALSLLHYPESAIEWTPYKKTLMAMHYRMSGSPSSAKSSLMDLLERGESSITSSMYLQEWVQRLASIDPFTLIHEHPKYIDQLNTDEYGPIILGIFDHYFKIWKEEIAPRGLVEKIEIQKYTNYRRSLKARYKAERINKIMYSVELIVDGFNFRTNITMGGNSSDISSKLSHDSVKKLKKLMYEMSEISHWEDKYIQEAINFIAFDHKVLNAVWSKFKSIVLNN